MAAKPRIKTRELRERVSETGPYFIWGLLHPDDEATAQRYGFDSVQEALGFWIRNNEAFKKQMRPHPGYFEGANSTVDALIEGAA